MIQEADDRIARETGQRRVKVVERGGSTLMDMLGKANPWESESCGREDCFPCKTEAGRGGNCQAESSTYSVSCQECKGRGVDSRYFGETSRTPYLRGQEHLAGLRRGEEDNALWKHCCEHHQGERVKFSMKVGRKHRTPLTRQLEEAVAIETKKVDILLNSKSEFHGSRIPRVRIEVGDKIVESKEEKKKKQWGMLTQARCPDQQKPRKVILAVEESNKKVTTTTEVETTYCSAYKI